MDTIVEYIIPYLCIDEIRDLCYTSKEYDKIISYYLETKKKHTISGYFNKAEFNWLMRKMKSLTHLTIEYQKLYGVELFMGLPPTLETLILKDRVSITWNAYYGSIQWHMPPSLSYLYYHILYDTNDLETNKKVFPKLKDIRVDIDSCIEIQCLYNPIVDGYDRYGPKYDYNDDYILTDLFTDHIPYTEYFKEHPNFHNYISTRVFPALENLIIPEANEQEEPPIDIHLLDTLPWPRYKPETT